MPGRGRWAAIADGAPASSFVLEIAIKNKKALTLGTLRLFYVPQSLERLLLNVNPSAYIWILEFSEGHNWN